VRGRTIGKTLEEFFGIECKQDVMRVEEIERKVRSTRLAGTGG